ncbi:MAG: Coenzyme F420 hydrogenase/dehydrogenase, beta subunit C-terminal domain [Bacteroidales bacterium]|nr:Coenzyme F420 hydrogenase/dehydrogenase, beta subunit C-terminal domain [Bacteroidales bacterium]
MIQIQDRKQCCGCSACADACSRKAIRMVPDGMGFPYPAVDRDRCVECGICESICAFHPVTAPAGRAFAVRFPDYLDRSQSGGLGYALMRKAVREGMVVYGAAMGDDFVVRHRRVTTEGGLEPLRLSKYVQSDLTGIPGQVLEDLKAGKKVLFTGTPCQCAGIGALAGSHRDALLLVDITCHGVPGPYVWRDYLKYMEKREGERLTGALFRDPAQGWHGSREKLCFGSRSVLNEDYSYLYFRCFMMRPSCLACPFASLSRPSDLTMADCWGVEKALPGFADDNRGCSLMLVNTDAGSAFAASFDENPRIREVDIDDVLQPNLQAPTVAHKYAPLFERSYVKHGFAYVLRHFGKDSWNHRIASCIVKVKKWL